MLQISIKFFSKNYIIYVEYFDKISIIENKIDINLLCKGPFGYYKDKVKYFYESKILD